MATRGSRSEAQLPAMAPSSEIVDANDKFTIFPNRNGDDNAKVLTGLFILLIAALAAQAAVAAECRHTRAKDHAVASEQLRNSNA